MESASISSAELVLLLLWLCAPALFVAIALQLMFLWHRALLGVLRPSRMAVAFVLTSVAVVILSVPIWLSLPLSFIPGSVIPGSRMYGPPFFLPAFLAGLVVAPLTVLWLVHGRRRVGV